MAAPVSGPTQSPNPLNHLFKESIPRYVVANNIPQEEIPSAKEVPDLLDFKGAFAQLRREARLCANLNAVSRSISSYNDSFKQLEKVPLFGNMVFGMIQAATGKLGTFFSNLYQTKCGVPDNNNILICPPWNNEVTMTELRFPLWKHHSNVFP